ncbi:hypothetical protein M1O55_02105 [Dehalococcoidia bacterium]|nr:hypothetical protein [Dehalococcoidia bacterium]
MLSFDFQVIVYAIKMEIGLLNGRVNIIAANPLGAAEKAIEKSSRSTTPHPFL